MDAGLWHWVATVALALVNVMGTFIVTSMRDALRSNAAAIAKLRDELPGTYQRRDEATRMEDRIVTEVRAVRDEMHEMRVGVMQLLQRVAGHQ